MHDEGMGDGSALIQAPDRFQRRDELMPGTTSRALPQGIAFFATVVFAIVAGRAAGSFFQVIDAEHYLRLAHGDATVMQPFASRQLGPLLVRCAAAALHMRVEHGFVLQGTFALLVLAAFVFFRAVRRTTPFWLLAAMVIVPFWPQMFHGLVLPDLWYAALLAVFLLFLQREQWTPAACMMLPLMLSRESTSLLLLCFLLAGWRELRWMGRLTAVGAAAVGAAVTSRLAAHSPGNTEQLPGFLYLLFKLPWNMVRLLGINPWSNRYQALCPVPRWQMPLHVGQVTTVGVCGVSGLTPFLALDAMTTTFGLLPLLALWMWRRLPKAGRRSLLLRFSLLYGGVSFVLAPMIGVSYARLFGYAWPLVLVAVPLLAAEPGAVPLLQKLGTRWKLLLFLHVLACAACLFGSLWALLPAVVVWMIGFVLLFGSRTAPRAPQTLL